MLDVATQRLENPTSENLGVWICERAKPKLMSEVQRLARLVVRIADKAHETFTLSD